MSNPFDTISVHQNHNGEFVCAFIASGGQIITLVCANEESARLMAAHLSSMVNRVVVGEVAF
jgi:hypothetical protein